MTGKLQVVVFLALGILALGLAGAVPDELLLQQIVAAATTEAFPELGVLAARLLMEAGAGPEAATLLASAAGWSLAPAILRLSHGQGYHAGLAFHPAPLLLAAGGLGFAASGCLLLFAAMERLAGSGEARDTPVLALGLLAAMLCIPHFERMALWAVSPLFLLAPRPMLERHMTAFYLVLLMPFGAAFLLKAVTGSLTPLIASREAEASTFLPLMFAGPSLGLLLPIRAAARLVLPVALFVAGLISTGILSPFATFLIASTAAAFAMRGRLPGWAEVLFAAATCLVAALH